MKEKVLVVSNMFPNDQNPSYGIFVKRFCEQLELIGKDYDVVAITKKNNKIKKIISYIIFFSKSFILYFKKEYSIIYIHYASHSSLSVIFANMFLKKRIFVNLHGSDVSPENKKQEKMQRYTKKILKISEKIIVPSEYFKNYVSQKYNTDKNKIYIYPSGGVDFNVFNDKNQNEKILLRKKNGISKNAIVFGFVGRIAYGKGWNTFLDAINLIESRKEVIFVIVGNGDQYNMMKEKIAFIKKKNIKLYPLLAQKELSDMYNCFDCFVFPTERESESLGLVGLESMACGCSVIASDFAAPKYYINNRNGFKFKKGDSAELKSKILEYMDLSANEKEKMKEEAIKTAKEYENTRIMKTLEEILR